MEGTVRRITMEFPEQLEPLLKEGAKVYYLTNNKIAKVERVAEKVITVNAGTKKAPMYLRYEIPEYKQMLINEEIVPMSRCNFDDEGEFNGLKPKDWGKSAPPQKKPSEPPKKAPESVPATEAEAEYGWINEKTGKFSSEKKRGYTQIKFERVKKKVELELDETQMEKLKELGLL